MLYRFKDEEGLMRLRVRCAGGLEGEEGGAQVGRRLTLSPG